MNIQPHLDKNSSSLVAELKELMSKELPDDVRCIHVLVFREGLPGIPFYIYFLNRFQSSARGMKPFEPISELGVLIDSPEYIDREEALVEYFDNEDESEFTYEEISDKYNSDNLAVAKWFSLCWKEAGGEFFNKPAFLSEEDGAFKTINLKTGSFISNSQEFSEVFDG